MKTIHPLLLAAILLGSCADRSRRAEIEQRRAALTARQDSALLASQQELAIVDSTLEVVKQQYASMQQEVEQHKAALKATPEELTALTRLRMHRDSLQVRFDALCNQIKYIHQLQNKK